MPGVRKSIDRMNSKAAAESLPQIAADPLVALAEQLAPMLKAAEWHDRADAALAGIAKIDLRDIRSVIAAADRAARTDETRALAESLRTGLAQRLEVDQRQWLDELAKTIAESRTIRALRLSSRPPKAGTPLPPDMAERLAGLASADLDSNTNQQRWSTVVDSVALSPVRTQVVPVGIPDKPSDDLLTTMRRLADRVPQIAGLFGVEPQAPRPRTRRPPPPPPAPAADKQAEKPADAPQPAADKQAEKPADATEQPAAAEASADAPQPAAAEATADAPQPAAAEATADATERPDTTEQPADSEEQPAGSETAAETAASS